LLGQATACRDSGCRKREKKKTNSIFDCCSLVLPHLRGIEPLTYRLEIRSPEYLTSLKLNSYLTPQNRSTVNSTENSAKIQEDLAKVIDRWSSLPPNIKAAIMVLIGGDEDE
jgi:hypothetical protein